MFELLLFFLFFITKYPENSSGTLYMKKNAKNNIISSAWILFCWKNSTTHALKTLVKPQTIASSVKYDGWSCMYCVSWLIFDRIINTKTNKNFVMKTSIWNRLFVSMSSTTYTHTEYVHASIIVIKLHTKKLCVFLYRNRFKRSKITCFKYSMFLAAYVYTYSKDDGLR